MENKLNGGILADDQVFQNSISCFLSSHILSYGNPAMRETMLFLADKLLIFETILVAYFLLFGRDLERPLRHWH